jgi:hypothetical protein
VQLRDKLALAVAGVFLVLNIIVPVVWGDIYPFTSGPMFRDAPLRYCNYSVYGPDGQLLDAETFLVHRIYDGNPVGYGVGVKPPEVLEDFGIERDEAYCRQHLLEHLSAAANRKYRFVEIVQEVVGPVDEQHVGVIRKDRWRVENPHFVVKQQ